MTSISYSRHQFPPVVIQQAVWLYLRFTLSYRDVESSWLSAAWIFRTRPSDAGF